MEEPPAHPSDFPSSLIADPTNPIPVPVLNHPPYDEMITTAIGALNERDGSSKRAIAKYIEQQYPNLPPTHSALLTHHLQCLKNSGQLSMVKHSYILPRSVPPVTAVPPAEPYSAAAPAPPSSNGVKRGRGRPRKIQVNLEPQSQPQPQLPLQPQFLALTEPQPQLGGENGSQAMLAQLGLADGPGSGGSAAKRPRGRPKKPKVETGVPDAKTVTPRRLGRPSKPKVLPDGTVPIVPKRPRGRPPLAASVGVLPSNNVPRSRGRPRKGSASRPVGRPRGRPPAAVAALTPEGVQLPGKVAGVKKTRKLSGKPLGRPRKGSVISPDSQYLVSYQVLKTKYDNVKLKVQQAVSVIKPHINSETPASVVRAVEELEGIVEMEAAAPATTEVPVQQPVVENQVGNIVQS